MGFECQEQGRLGTIGQQAPHCSIRSRLYQAGSASFLPAPSSNTTPQPHFEYQGEEIPKLPSYTNAYTQPYFYERSSFFLP